MVYNGLTLFIFTLVENTHDLKISPDKVFPFSFPMFPDEDDPLVSSKLSQLLQITFCWLCLKSIVRERHQQPASRGV